MRRWGIHPHFVYKRNYLACRTLLISMPLCKERQFLLDSYESALDDYVASVQRSVSNDDSDNGESHAELLRRREALVSHCLDHGCGTAVRAAGQG